MISLKTILLQTLSAYLLVLMVLPCSDVHVSQQKSFVSNYELLQTSTDDSHNDMELCTPFCICAGCVVAVIIQKQLEFIPFNPEVFTKKVTNFYISPTSNFFGSIWQPPQLV